MNCSIISNAIDSQLIVWVLMEEVENNESSFVNEKVNKVN